MVKTILKIDLVTADGKKLLLTTKVDGDLINLLKETKKSEIKIVTNDGIELSLEYTVKSIKAGTIYAELTDESKQEFEKHMKKKNFKLELVVDNENKTDK